jgi:hypothetical protein
MPASFAGFPDIAARKTPRAIPREECIPAQLKETRHKSETLDWPTKRGIMAAEGDPATSSKKVRWRRRCPQQKSIIDLILKENQEA